MQAIFLSEGVMTGAPNNAEHMLQIVTAYHLPCLKILSENQRKAVAFHVAFKCDRMQMKQNEKVQLDEESSDDEPGRKPGQLYLFGHLALVEDLAVWERSGKPCCLRFSYKRPSSVAYGQLLSSSHAFGYTEIGVAAFFLSCSIKVFFESQGFHLEVVCCDSVNIAASYRIAAEHGPGRRIAQTEHLADAVDSGTHK